MFVFLKHMLHWQFNQAVSLNYINIISLADDCLSGKVLDIGCNDGTVIQSLFRLPQTSTRFLGIDIVHHRLVDARKNGLAAAQADAASSLPFADSSIDFILSNQVIEHVASVDLFMAEIVRILRPGGHAIISTENASSWCNVGALVLGFQMFSLTNMSSRKSGIGNPFAIHRGEEVELSSWTHKTIFSLRGLKEFAEAHGLQVKQARGAGYFPLPSAFGKIDVRHAHFISVLLHKPLEQ